MSEKNKKLITAFLIILIITPVILFSNARYVIAEGAEVPTHDALLQTEIAPPTDVNAEANEEMKELRLWEYVLMAIVQELLNQMTQSVVNWINSGFHGAPLFLENPDDFFGDIVKYEIRSMVDQFGYDLLRFPFGKDWALSVIGAYKSTLANNAAHSLSSVMSQAQITSYMNFDVGGWNSFFLETQYPQQNSYLGSQMLLNRSLYVDLGKAIQAPAEKVMSALNQGMGFLSPEMCMDEGTKYNDTMANAWNRPSFEGKCVPAEPACTNTPNGCTPQQYQEWGAECAKQKAEFDKNNTCKNLVRTTPGAVVANQIMTSLDTKTNEPMMAALMGTLESNIATIIDALMNKFLGDGLTALADTINDEPEENNWSYYGECIDENCDSNAGPGPLDIPQNVSVMIGETTSTEISGGKAPYSIKITDPITPDTTIATASLTGATLSITGITPGQTSVTITDSREENPRKAKVKITVVGDGSLMATPAEVIIKTLDDIVVTISGGTAEYTISNEPDRDIAKAKIAANKLLIFSQSIPGETSVTIKDSSSPAQTITIPIKTVDPNLTADPASIDLAVGETTDSTISGGITPYVIQIEPDENIAVVELSNSTLTITGVAEGETSITIKDSSSSNESVTIYISVSPSSPAS